MPAHLLGLVRRAQPACRRMRHLGGTRAASWALSTAPVELVLPFTSTLAFDAVHIDEAVDFSEGDCAGHPRRAWS